jgi:hypothetical protein
VRLEHEVELARLGEVAVGRLARAPAGFAAAARVLELVGAKAETRGSLKPATWPDASQTRGLRMIAESSATMSSRSCTIARSHWLRMFVFMRTP